MSATYTEVRAKCLGCGEITRFDDKHGRSEQFAKMVEENDEGDVIEEVCWEGTCSEARQEMEIVEIADVEYFPD